MVPAGRGRLHAREPRASRGAAGGARRSAGAPENTLSKPVTGINGVYLFDVTSRKTLDNVTPESERVRLEANAESYISERLMQALMDQSDITDNRVKFF